MKKKMLLITAVLLAFFSFAQEPLPGKAVFSNVSVKDTVRFVSQYATDTIMSGICGYLVTAV